MLEDSRGRRQMKKNSSFNIKKDAVNKKENKEVGAEDLKEGKCFKCQNKLEATVPTDGRQQFA